MNKVEDLIGHNTIKSFEYMNAVDRGIVAEWLTSTCDKKLDNPADCERMSDVMWANDVILSYHTAQELWREHSKANDSEWIVLPSEDKNLLEILNELWLGDSYE